MFKNYIKTAWRNLRKNTAFSFINILGLTIGITACMLIFLFIMNEFSFDNFHKDGNRTYRVTRGIMRDGQAAAVSYLSGRYSEALLTDFKGQVESAVRVNQNNDLIVYGNRSFNEKKVIDADNNFFTFFSFPLVAGDPHTVLQHPNSIVLTETAARKYFGNVNEAIGKTLMLDKETPLTVTGIARDVPSNSHLVFDMVIPLEIYKKASWMTNWINNGVYTYIKLAPNVAQAQIDKELPAFMEKYMGASMRGRGFHFTLSLSPLTDVYFSNTADHLQHGDKKVVYIFLSIAILILLIACINFINLSTIRAAERSKEVGLRKVLGALRSNIIWQFIGESVLLTTISCLLAVGLLLLAMPLYNQLLGYQLPVSWHTWPVYLFLAGVIVLSGFLAGSYPAFLLSGFLPVQALKGKLRIGKSGAWFRQSLVTVQFSISVLLIISTFIITRQMSYVKNKQLGYDKEQTILVRIDNNDIYRNMLAFKNQLQNESQIESVSLASGEPGGYFDGQMFSVEGHDEKWNARTEFADFEFVHTFGLSMIAGRDFSSSFPADTTHAVIINKTAAVSLGWTPEQAIGKWIENTTTDTARRQIIGVVSDFNFQSLKNTIEPLVIAPNDDRRVAAVKLKPGNIQAGIALIEKTYKRAADAYPFEYSFLDQQFDNLYKKDIRQQTILLVFAIMAIFVACLGLFGIASFTTLKRFKEIGVRKVLGSSVQSIVILLSKDLLRPVIIATCIAMPAGYWAMSRWLQSFAYKITLSWWIFVSAALVTFGIALFTICTKAVKAALANPAKSLRAE